MLHYTIVSDDVHYRAGKEDVDYNVQTRYGRQHQQHIDERLWCPHVSVNKITDFFFFFFFFARITVVNACKAKFLAGYLNSCNSLCNLFGYVAASELNELQCHVI